MSNYLTNEERASMQAESNARLYQLADRWRLDQATQRRTPHKANERVSIFPGGNTNVTDDSTGVVGAKETYVGYVARSSDVEEGDQYRNVRDGRSGAQYMTDVRFTISTAARYPTIISLRLHEEG